MGAVSTLTLGGQSFFYQDMETYFTNYIKNKRTKVRHEHVQNNTCIEERVKRQNVQIFKLRTICKFCFLWSLLLPPALDGMISSFGHLTFNMTRIVQGILSEIFSYFVLGHIPLSLDRPLEYKLKQTRKCNSPEDLSGQRCIRSRDFLAYFEHYGFGCNEDALLQERWSEK